jgi:hypothetical protein
MNSCLACSVIRNNMTGRFLIIGLVLDTELFTWTNLGKIKIICLCIKRDNILIRHGDRISATLIFSLLKLK